MAKRRIKDLALLLSVLLVTRVAFRSHYLYDIDSVNFALGMRRFDPASYQPHPPGYFLYILLARVVDLFFHDANNTLVAISIAASCGALIMIYRLTEEWFDRGAALFAGWLVVFSPLVWFHGTVALIYAVELFFSSLTGYLCWQRRVVPAAIVLGIAAGFRPSFLMFLGPLVLLVAGRRRIGKAALAFFTTALAWFIPMTIACGGFGAWWSSLHSLVGIAAARQTIFNASPIVSLVRLVSIIGIFGLCFGIAAVLAFRIGIPADRKLFFWAWVLPGLTFFSLIFLLFVNSGYLLVISPPAFVLLGQALSESKWRYAVAANTLIFLFAPVYCSYTSVRHFESELESVIRTLPKVATADTMIVGFDSHFLGYRHAGYYLPQSFTAQYPEVNTRVFTMEHGDTQVVTELPLRRFRRFVLLPLPSDDTEYGAYMAMVRKRFPATTVNSFTVGDVKDLPLLFPHAASASSPRMSRCR